MISITDTQRQGTLGDTTERAPKLAIFDDDVSRLEKLIATYTALGFQPFGVLIADHESLVTDEGKLTYNSQVPGLEHGILNAAHLRRVLQALNPDAVMTNNAWSPNILQTPEGYDLGAGLLQSVRAVRPNTPCIINDCRAPDPSLTRMPLPEHTPLLFLAHGYPVAYNTIEPATVAAHLKAEIAKNSAACKWPLPH